jgi:DNA repair exonuclease SbcCD nuclease subunit
LVTQAIEETVDFMVIAGDVYDGDWKDFNTGLFFVRQMGRLRQAGIPVYLLYGNHDAESEMTRGLELPDNVHVFSSRKAETFLIEHHQVALHGRSFKLAATTDNLLPSYPEPVPGWLNIGVLHTALEGYAGEHATYAPVTPAGLAAKGYGYWALGHVHAFMNLQHGPSRIVYPGNLQGRHVREKGRKGIVVVSYEGSAIRAVDHVPCDVVRWHDIHVEPPEGSLSAQLGHVAREIRGKLAEDEADQVDSAVRIRLAGLGAEGEALGPRGRRDRLREALRDEALEAGGTVVGADLEVRAQRPQLGGEERDGGGRGRTNAVPLFPACCFKQDLIHGVCGSLFHPVASAA